MINADKVKQWKQDVNASVDMYNKWFLQFAPVTYRASRLTATQDVKVGFIETQDLRSITPATLKNSPKVLQTLRMCTAPPLARDRLVGLSSTSKSLVQGLEAGNLPARMTAANLDKNLKSICTTILPLLDTEIFPWLDSKDDVNPENRDRAATVVADRLTGAVADPIIRNAQEERQLRKIREFLEGLGYQHEDPEPGTAPTELRPGTFCFRFNIKVKQEGEDKQGEDKEGEDKEVNIPVDVVIQPKKPAENLMPIFVECKSAGDFANTNKRRKEEATKVRQMRATYGEDTKLYLFLCGYFDTNYLAYEAAEGLDWIWEHRIGDLAQLVP